MINPTKIEPPAVRASRLQLERAAVDETFCDYMTRSEPYGPSEGEIAHSQAVSLKRIADGLSELLQFLDRHSWEGAIQIRDVGRHC